MGSYTQEKFGLNLSKYKYYGDSWLLFMIVVKNKSFVLTNVRRSLL